MGVCGGASVVYRGLIIILIRVFALLRTVIKPTKHPELGTHMEVFALCDIEPYAECFSSYGEEYWLHQRLFSKRNRSGGIVPKKLLVTLGQYATLHQKYEDAIMTLFV